MQVDEIMVPDPITVEPDTPLGTALALMDEHAIRHLPVVRDGFVVGVLSDRDLLGEMGWLVARDGTEPILGSAAVGDVVRKRPLTIAPGDSAAHAAELMSSQRVGCLPVCRGDALLGLVTEIDLLEAFHGSARYGRLSEQENPPVEQVMTREPVSVPFEASPGDAMTAMLKEEVRHLLVLDGERLVGLLSERDLRRCARPQSMEIQCAGEIATREVSVVRPDEKLSTAAFRMARKKIGALVVRSGEGPPVGIVTTADVLAFSARAHS